MSELSEKCVYIASADPLQSLLIISGTGKATNVEVVNKTANIKCKLTSLQHRVRPTNSHIQTGTNHFTKPS